MPAYDIAANDQDGNSESTDEMISVGESTWGSFYVGYDTYPIDAAFIWDTTSGTAVPQGVTIDTAYVTITRESTDYSSGFTGNWYGFDVDTPDDFLTSHIHRISDHHARTTANVVDDDWPNTATHQSPSLVSIIQEIVDRAGFSGVIGLTWRSRTTASGWFEWRDYSTSATSVAELTVEWTAGGGGVYQGKAHPSRNALLRM